MRHPLNTSNPFSFDYRLLALTLALTAFGLFMLSSASSYTGFERFHDTYYFTKQQLVHAVLGIAAMLILARIPRNFWKTIAFPAFVASLILLLLVLIPGIGVKINNARSWIDLGFTTLQPSEFAKVSFLLYLSLWLERRRGKVHEMAYGFLPFLALLGLLAGLILLQPDPGTMFIVAATAISVFFVAGGKFMHICILMLVGALLAGGLIMSAPYRRERIKVFLDPASDPSGVGYHVNQAMLAIGSGGMWGVGLGKSRQKFNYLPEVAGDSIFAVIGEEVGFVVSVAYIVALGFFLTRLTYSAEQSRDDFGRYFTIGVALWIGIQSLVNIGAMIGLLPLTGLPLPFVSFGGTALLATLSAVGIVLSLSRHGTA